MVTKQFWNCAILDKQRTLEEFLLLNMELAGPGKSMILCIEKGRLKPQ